MGQQLGMTWIDAVVWASALCQMTPSLNHVSTDLGRT
jgi:hypothetical protein